MESATILTPLAPPKGVFCFLREPYIPEGPEYEKISTLYLNEDEKCHQP